MKLTVIKGPDSEKRKVVVRELVRYNDANCEKEDYKEVEFYLQDETGEIRGGIIGNTHWGWLFIKQLWVDNDYRGQKAGTQLVNAAENAAKQTGCAYAWLDTFDFQALSFYQKLGYESFGTLDDFPQGHKRFYLRKKL